MYHSCFSSSAVLHGGGQGLVHSSDAMLSGHNIAQISNTKSKEETLIGQASGEGNGHLGKTWVAGVSRDMQ